MNSDPGPIHPKGCINRLRNLKDPSPTPADDAPGEIQKTAAQGGGISPVKTGDLKAVFHKGTKTIEGQQEQEKEGLVGGKTFEG